MTQWVGPTSLGTIPVLSVAPLPPQQQIPVPSQLVSWEWVVIYNLSANFILEVDAGGQLGTVPPLTADAFQVENSVYITLTPITFLPVSSTGPSVATAYYFALFYGPNDRRPIGYPISLPEAALNNNIVNTPNENADVGYTAVINNSSATLVPAPGTLATQRIKNLSVVPPSASGGTTLTLTGVTTGFTYFAAEIPFYPAADLNTAVFFDIDLIIGEALKITSNTAGGMRVTCTARQQPIT